jgi:hypothetical protein
MPIFQKILKTIESHKGMHKINSFFAIRKRNLFIQQTIFIFSSENSTLRNFEKKGRKESRQEM